MRTGTLSNLCNQWRLCVPLILFFSFFFPNLSHGIGASLEGRTSFAGIPSGVIRDIEVRGDIVFVAAENGVFEIVGAQSQRITYSKAGTLTGIISDIHLDGDDLWIVEYGVGVFKLNLKTKHSEQVFSEFEWATSVWTVNSSKEHYFLSLIDEVIVLDRYSGNIKALSEHLVRLGVVEAYSIDSTSSGTWIAVRDGLIKLSNDSNTIHEKEVASDFPLLSSITFVKDGGRSIYVGGPEGLYVVDKETNSLYFARSSGVKGTFIQDVWITDNNEVWVSDGTVFKLEQGRLIRPKFLNPVLGSETVRTVTRIIQGPQDSLLIASSQLGLIALSQATRAINLISDGEVVLRSNINQVVTVDESVYVSTDKQFYQLNVVTGALTPSSLDSEYSHCEMLPRKVFTMSIGEVFPLQCKDVFKHVVDVTDDSFYLYSDNGMEASYFLVRGSKLEDRLQAPRLVVESILLSSGELASFDVYDNIHFQLSKHSWRTIRSSVGRWTGVQCLIEVSDAFLLCTSGAGMRKIRKDTGEVESPEEFHIDGLRFIRDAVVTSSKNIWLATNMGLYAFEAKSQRIFKLGSSHGIFDTDFEYKSFSVVGDQLLVKGDKYSYLIDETRALVELNKERSSPASAVLTSVHWVEEGDIQQRFFPRETSLEFSGTLEEATFNFATNSFIKHLSQKLELQLDSEGWMLHSSPTMKVSLSDLDFGEHIIKARVFSPDNSGPVTTLKFTVAQPLWASPVSYSLYFLILTTIVMLFKFGFLNGLIEKFKSTNLYTNLTRFEITDGQSKFEKMLRSKERQISEITHDLRTPIQVIKGSLEQLSNEKGEENKEFILIKENMRRVEQLIEQMRNDIPRASSPSDYYKTYSVEHIRFIINSLEPLAKQKRQNLEVRVKGARYISLINDSLEKIITNLLQNAIKYTGEYGNIRVIVSIDKKVLKIIVSDDGIGMDARLLGKVFERFTRGETQEEGQGIGLSIVKNLTELNQGKIDVESKPGEGSKFTVRLPVDDIEFVNTEAAQLELKGETTSQKTLLIVDDSREFRTYMFDLLSTNYRCLVAGNGEQALDVMQRFLVDLVVTDQIMPKMDGLTLTSEIRAHASHSNIPVIMLSAKTDPQLEKAALEVKVDYFLAKPASSEEISLRIAHFLSVRDAQSIDENGGNKPIFKFGCLEIPEINNEKDMAFYLNFIAVLEKNYHREEFNRDQAAEQLLMSTRSLNRRLAELFEYNFSEFLSRFRIEKSIPILLEGHSILDTCLDVGFGTAAYFSTSFKKVMKVPPKKYIEQYRKTVA